MFRRKSCLTAVFLAILTFGVIPIARAYEDATEEKEREQPAVLQEPSLSELVKGSFLLYALNRVVTICHLGGHYCVAKVLVGKGLISNVRMQISPYFLGTGSIDYSIDPLLQITLGIMPNDEDLAWRFEGAGAYWKHAAALCLAGPLAGAVSSYTILKANKVYREYKKGGPFSLALRKAWKAPVFGRKLFRPLRNGICYTAIQLCAYISLIDSLKQLLPLPTSNGAELSSSGAQLADILKNTMGPKVASMYGYGVGALFAGVLYGILR